MIVLIDEGHGGIKDGVYQTKGKKQYHFTDKNESVYEGELNREYGERLHEMVKKYADVIRVAHEYKDTPLADRVAIANAIHKVQPCIYISLHNNAASAGIKGFGSKATGTEVITSAGQTKSDVLAENVIRGIREEMPNRVIRMDKRDGDMDKEMLLYVLEKTTCPAILVEVGFFDNWDEVLRIYDPKFIDRVCKGIATGIYKFIK